MARCQRWSSQWSLQAAMHIYTIPTHSLGVTTHRTGLYSMHRGWSLGAFIYWNFTKFNFVLRNAISFYEMQFRSTKFTFRPRNLNFVHEIRSFYTWHPVGCVLESSWAFLRLFKECWAFFLPKNLLKSQEKQKIQVIYLLSQIHSP